MTKLRPLCPTRWTARLEAVNTTIEMYGEIVKTLKELSQGRGHVATRAGGLLEQMRSGNMYVSLVMARTMLAPLDHLSRRLQRKTCTASDLSEGARATREFMASVRECADETVSCALQAVEESPLELEAPTVPRQICPPKRLTGSAPGHKVAGPR